MRCMTATLGALALALTGTSVQSAPPGSAADHLRSAAQAGSKSPADCLSALLDGRRRAAVPVGRQCPHLWLPRHASQGPACLRLHRVAGRDRQPAACTRSRLRRSTALQLRSVASDNRAPGPDILVEPERVSNGLNLLVARADTRGSAGKRRALVTGADAYQGFRDPYSCGANSPDLIRWSNRGGRLVPTAP